MAQQIDHRRRALLLGAAGALTPLAGCGGASGAATDASPASSLVADPGVATTNLPIIALDEGVIAEAGNRTFSLVAQRGTAQLRSGVAANTFGYNGPLLGPALHLRTGELTTVQVRNQLGEPTTVHWHGLIVPAVVDGGPHQAIAAGARWEATFTVANAASTCWFHPHMHGTTGRQVVMGLAGLLIVDDTAQNVPALPHSWGVDDIALVLQDKRLTSAGQIDYALSAADRQTGYAGGLLLVNGVAGPVWQAPQQWIRLRLLNGCNARTLALRLGNGAAWLQVANEGGLLPAPVVRTSIILGAGERAEALVNFGSVAIGQDVSLIASGVSSGATMGPGATEPEVTALTMRVSRPRQPDAIAQPPSAMSTSAAVVAPSGATVRTFTLDGGMMGSPFSINGQSFDIGRIDLGVPANSVEVWKFVNRTGMAHPMHVHGVWMSLLSRNGGALAPYEQGLRDTFVVGPMETVDVAVRTAALASSSPLMFHCHILEHEDAGMMGQFVTT